MAESTEERKQRAKGLLDSIRDSKFAVTEWYGNGLADKPFDKEMLAYRQALRDVPKNNPDVDINEKGDLINIDWPVLPESYYNKIKPT